jgi:predicted DNA-binding protein (UPF0251 family)
MSRPLVPRRVCCHLEGRGFRPIGTSAFRSGALTLARDELEAIRLADVEGLYQDAAADRMGVSRPTYARILSRGRHAVAVSLIERRMLVVGQGPVVEEMPPVEDCPVHGGARRQGRTCRCPSRRPARTGVKCPCGPCAAASASSSE